MGPESEGESLRVMRAAGRQGRYAQAAAYADALAPALRARPAIALERARARLWQGRMTLAVSALDDADLRLATPGERLILSLEASGLLIYRSAAFRAALTSATTAFANAADADVDAADVAEARRIHARIVLTAATYYEVDAVARRSARDTLSEIADVLEQAGRLDRALAARLTIAEQLDDRAERLEALSAFAARALAADRPGIAGEALVSRAAQMLAADPASAAIDADLDEALAAFARCGHAHGPIDVRRARAQLAAERGLVSVEELHACLDEYRRVEFPRGELTLLMDLSQAAHERGDVSAAAEHRRAGLALAEDIGTELTRDNFQLSLADLLMRSGDYGGAIELSRAAIAAAPAAFMVASHEELVSAAYALLGDDEAAITHARRALDTFAALGADGAASTAALKLASDLVGTDTPAQWDRAEALMREWIVPDVAREDLESAASKRELLAQLEIKRAVAAVTTREQSAHLDAATTEIAIGEALAEQLPRRARAQRLGNLQQLRGQLLQTQDDIDGVEAAFATAAATYASAGMAMEAANCHYLIGVLRLNRANKSLEPHFGVAETHLREALRYYSEAGMRGQEADTRFMFARLYVNAEGRALELRDALLDAALGHLAEAEAGYDAVRREYAVGTILEAQRGKQALIARSHRIYELALEVACVYRPDPVIAWSWTQRSKARALGDALGSGTLAPARTLAALHAHPDALALIASERQLTAQIDTQPDARPALRARLAALHERMAADPRLADYLALRAGAALEREDLAAMVADRDDCVFFDWVAVGDALLLLALRPGDEPKLVPLQMRAGAVATFVADNLGPRSFRLTLRDAPELLRACDPLIAPIAELSSRDDLLVLCPAGALHALPLHALELDGEPLIARNPVAYCPSLGILRHCLARGASRSPLSAALFGDPNDDREEAARIVEDLAAFLGTTPVLGAGVTRAAFASMVAGRDLVHFQGHAKHDRDDPLSSQLVLADGPLTARDIFGLRDVRAALVTLAACESAANVVAAGDEPLGLIPAFLYAGAGAVLASMWKVQGRSAARMMGHFYDALGSEGIDTAQMLRQAALEVRRTPGLKAPYHWAPFVLHGDWH